MDSTSKVELIKQAIKQVMEEVEGDTKSSSSPSDDDGDGVDNHRHLLLLSKLMSQGSCENQTARTNLSCFLDMGSIRDGERGVIDCGRVNEGNWMAWIGSRSSRANNGSRMNFCHASLERLEGDAEIFPSSAVSKSEPAIDDELAKANNNTTSRLEENEEEKIVKELKEVKRQNLITHCLISVMIVLTVAWQISEVSIILKLKDGVTHPFRSIGSVLKGMLRPPIANGDNEDAESSITSNLIESSPVHDLKVPSIHHVELPKIDFCFSNEN